MKVRLAARVMLALTVITPAAAANPDAKIEPAALGKLGHGGTASFLVRFGAPAAHAHTLALAARGADRRRAVHAALRDRAREAQAAARRWLDERRIPYRQLWIVNALQVEADLGVARALAARPEVERIVADPAVRGVPPLQLDATLAPAAVEWGVARVRAPDVWALDGVRGEGVVVASADTGVEWSHPALRPQYRGWDGTAASHDFHWHDAIDGLAAPLDDYGHGTHTTGSMVGDDGLGNQVGVAPGARWIGCRNMDGGIGQPSTYLECIQFFLAPWPHGGDPETDGDPARAPHIVNNSWGCPAEEGCDPATLRDAFAALEAAGILAVASAGNSGSACGSVTDPPAIYAEALIVGATSASGALASFSARGPVAVDGSGRMRPDVAAPGVSVRSSTLGGGYGLSSGTSMAGPHAAGAAALLWSVRPELRGSLALTRCMLTRTAGPVTVSGAQVCGGTSALVRPNNLFGWGVIDALEAIHPSADADLDGVTDPCDCAPEDGGAFDLPREIGALAFDADRATVRWAHVAAAAGPGTAYDVVRGGLADLAARGGVAGAGCLASGLVAPEVADPESPAAGDGFFYLVAARNGCGTGGWGRGSNDTQRSPGGCP